jgi:adenine-specific DNA-methyltransferase
MVIEEPQVPDPDQFLESIDLTRIDALRWIDKERQSELGQFFTQPAIARTMAGLFSHLPDRVSILDPGAGIGILTAAFVARALQSSPKPSRIEATCFEIDPSLVQALRKTLEACKDLCDRFQVAFSFKIVQDDFIASSVEILRAKDSLFEIQQPHYNLAILNPPYKKINSASRTRHLLQAVGIETSNLYTAFLWLVTKLLSAEGQFVAIVPRSFCNGTYFRPFRAELLQLMKINHIHIYESRDKAFEEGDVLQENIIFHATKTSEPRTSVAISSSQDPTDDAMTIREVAYDQLVYPHDPDLFIHIVPDQIGHQISNQINSLTTTLRDLGILVSTGRVVDFRARDLLRKEPDKEIIPLIYPHNLSQGVILWPRDNGKKPIYLASTPEVNELAIPAQFYVLVKRFSSKEEKRRVYAAVYHPNSIPAKRVGFENHLNYYHRRYGNLSPALAKGLALYLNSTIVDQYFRQFSGHTQVNAADLRNLKYPTEAQLISLGEKIVEEFPSQEEIDRLVAEELNLNNSDDPSGINDPIQARKKIKEALSILQMLSVPRAQQNDRSALTLLSLVNISPSSPWADAQENLIGITEMMDFFRDHYGIDYAPNTRETVRRQTVHQFMQMGLVIANPDDSARPINSPKTRYRIESKTLSLIRSFGTAAWEGNLLNYMREMSSLETLQVRERAMPMIPVTLPDGSQIMLSSGGQNDLIKHIIEEFCPRYTPGGKVIYIGDAGNKLTANELQYFEQLGFHIDRHGKMPDVIVLLPEKKWLVLIEAVTSHGPIDLKRHNELKELFGGGEYGLVFVTAFESRRAMHRFLSDIAWETEVWVSDAPSHLIHFNGERYLGPYPEDGA